MRAIFKVRDEGESSCERLKIESNAGFGKERFVFSLRGLSEKAMKQVGEIRSGSLPRISFESMDERSPSGAFLLRGEV